MFDVVERKKETREFERRVGGREEEKEQRKIKEGEKEKEENAQFFLD